MDYKELRKAAYIISTISHYIELPWKDKVLEKHFQNAFTLGIDNQCIEKLKQIINFTSSKEVYQLVKEIIISQDWEKNFAWQNRLFDPFKMHEIPERVENHAFFCVCSKNQEWNENIKGYNLIVKIFQKEGYLYCNYDKVWNDCSSQQSGINEPPFQQIDINELPNTFPMIMCFIKKTEETSKNKEETENSIEINKIFREIDKRLIENDQKSNYLYTEIVKLRHENENIYKKMEDMENIQTIFDKKIDWIVKEKIQYLEKIIEESYLFIKDAQSNSKSNLSHFKPFENNRSDLTKDNDSNNFSLIVSGVSDFFLYINSTSQKCQQSINELKQKLENCKNIEVEYHKLMCESKNDHQRLESKISNIEEIIQNLSSLNEAKQISVSKTATQVSRFKRHNSNPSKKQKKGLENIGNSCYLNSVLQIFASIPNFIETIGIIETGLFESLNDVLVSVTDPYSINTKEKLTSLRNALTQEYSMFDRNRENDCKELFAIIINLFGEIFQSDMFLINKHQAIICENNNHRAELSQPQAFLTIFDNGLSIEEWLSQLEKEENFYVGDNKLYCKTCGTLADSKIITDSIESHEILAFYNAKSKNRLNRIPDFLHLGKINYEIFGVIWYSERHYIAYTKDDGIWNEYNDEIVTPNKTPDPNKCYMLFYKASSVSP